jgi:hypothetical protein
MNILIGTAVLSTCLSQTGGEVTLAEKEAALQALTEFSAQCHTFFSGMNLKTTDMTKVRRGPEDGRISFSFTYSPGASVTVEKLPQRWVVQRYFGVPNNPKGEPAALLNKDADVIAQTHQHFGWMIKAHDLKLESVVWVPFQMNPASRPPTAGGTRYFRNLSTPHALATPHLFALWRRSDKALLQFSVNPYPDPDLPPKSEDGERS